VKTVIVLSGRGMTMFRPDLVEQPEQVRFVLVISEDEWSLVDTSRLSWFDEVRQVPCAVPSPPPLLNSLLDGGATRAVLRELLDAAEPGSVALLCYDELAMMDAAQLRAEFALPGPHPEDMLPYRDKCVMKERMIAAGVRVPGFGRVDPARFSGDRAGYFDDVVAAVGLPFILKPVDSAGSEGVHLVSGAEQFAGLPEELPGEFQYEEFVTGVMYSVNLVRQGGRTLFGGVTEYLVNTLDVRRGRVNADINLADEDPRVARMVAFAEEALDALGNLDGSTHLELFLTAADELVFLEVGARFKGLAGLAAMQRHYGVAIVNLTVQVEAGVASRPLDEEPLPCFDAVIPKRGGVVEALVEPPVESSVDITWKVAAGDVLEATDSLFTSGGTFLVSNKDYEALYRDFYRLADYEPIRYRAVEAG
jgi:biotin carboxylase